MNLLPGSMARRALGALLAGAVLTSCGGYAGHQVPRSAPTSSATPTSGQSQLSLAAQAEASARAITAAPVGAPSGAPSVSPGATATSPVTPPAACAAAGQDNVLVVRIPTQMRAGVVTLRVQLLQGALSRQVVFALGLPKPSPAGVTRSGLRYLIGLGGAGRPAALDGPWLPTAAATVIVEARLASESVVARRIQRFRFTLTSPKVKVCSRPNFSHEVVLRPRDRV